MRAVLLWGLMLVVACACRSADAAEVPADPTIPAALARNFYALVIQGAKPHLPLNI